MSQGSNQDSDRDFKRGEPWALMHGMPTNVLDVGGLRVARCDFDGDTSHPLSHLNAERIVACVNACAGISTELLAPGAVARMRDALIDARRELGNYTRHEMGYANTSALGAIETIDEALASPEAASNE